MGRDRQVSLVRNFLAKIVADCAIQLKLLRSGII